LQEPRPFEWFEGGVAGRREENFGDAETLLEEFAAASGEQTVAGKIAAGHRLSDVVEFFARDKGLVEGDTHAVAAGL
jgi:hypothetical protein